MEQQEKRRAAELAGEPMDWRAWTRDAEWRERLAQAVEARDLAGASELLECVIGLEIHLRLATGAKLFSQAPEGVAGWSDIGLPGALPCLDPRAAELASRLGRALGARAPERFCFERKRYAYPDLGKGYQTTQKGMCVFEGGSFGEGEGLAAQVERAQIEEDAARIERAASSSEIDYSRAGSPLLEVVTKAQAMEPSEAARLSFELWREAVRLRVCEGKIEEGMFKTDINLSLRPKGSQSLGARAEVKGVGAFGFVKKAALHEFWRQAEQLSAGELPIEQTRGFDEASGATRLMRLKGQESAYRFLPDGDLRVRATPPRGEEWEDRLMTMSQLKTLCSRMGLSARQREEAIADPRAACALSLALAPWTRSEAEMPEGAGSLWMAYLSRLGPVGATESDLLGAGLAFGWALEGLLQAGGARELIEACAAGWGAQGWSADAAQARLTHARLGALAPGAAVAALSEAMRDDPAAQAALAQWREGKQKAGGYLVGLALSALRRQGVKADAGAVQRELAQWATGESDER